MTSSADADEVADAVLTAVSTLLRRIRQVPAPGELTMPERSALGMLDRGGPSTSAELARQAQITAQAMGATLAGLQARGLIGRRPDPDDGRRVILSLTGPGRRLLGAKRSARVQQLSRVLDGLTAAELSQLAQAAPLLQRMAERL